MMFCSCLRSLSRFTFVLFASVALARGAETASPSKTDLAVTNEDSSLRFMLMLDEAGLGYRVDHLAGGAATPVIERSPLGLTRTDTELTAGLTLLSATAPALVEDNYTLTTGKQLKVHSRGIERTFVLQNSKHIRLNLTARAYRDGIAFRYELPGHGSQMLYLSGEATGFKLPTGGRTWVQPYSKVDVWAPGYESDYVNGAPVGTSAPGPEGWALPLLSHTNGLWVLITETGLEPNYFGVHLEPHAKDGLYRVRLPEEAETYGVAPQAATITLPWVSPWRVIVVSDRAGGVAESTLVTDLARPSEMKDTSWIKPGMAAWSWWGDMGSPRDYAKLVTFVDAAAKFHWRYSLLDLGWDEMKNGGDVTKLAAYAKSRGVDLTVWYNSAGRHNQVPDAGPKDVLNDALVRDAEFARIAALGIKGVKVDFMQSDKQFLIAMYHDIIRDAAKHHLVIDFHGCTIPRGWQRTYPNLVSMEAVRGAEQYWDKTFAENAQTFNTIYVFTRNAIGPMDYTPTIFTDPTQPDAQRVPHLTTNAHELALLVVFESGVQHVVDPAASLVAQPAFVQDYLTDLPTIWDESHVIAGAPGELAVLARRHGDTWYVAGINGERIAKSLRVPLTFLAGAATATLITDGATPHEFAHRDFTAQPAETLELSLAPRGGFAARFRLKH
jgi:alpha-glucosidase